MPADVPEVDDEAARNSAAGAVVLIGAVLIGGASFLPFGAVTQPFGTAGTQTVSGWDWFDGGIATGPLFALLALVAAALAGLLLSQVAPPAVRIGVIVVGAVSLGLASFAVSDILDRTGDVQALGSVDVTLRYGIGLVVIGAILIGGAGLIAKHRS